MKCSFKIFNAIYLNLCNPLSWEVTLFEVWSKSSTADISQYTICTNEILASVGSVESIFVTCEYRIVYDVY